MEKRILAKCGRKKAKCGRKKAVFGTQEAAILTAAGINSAAATAAAAVGASATKDAANRQAQATTAAAQKQAQAIKTQTENSKEYQLEAQNFIKDQNTESRELQKDIQMQLQMLTGQQNVNDRLEASKLVVKNGGRTKPRYSLRGNNTAFRVTDGGYVIPIGNTPEGYNLFEIRGNDHEHYHKAPGGKNKTGVGIKFADGNVIEGEGNQNTNQGEYMLQTPNAAYFISKHNIAGFNPAKAVNMGMHPLAAYNIQEQQKQINGITDDGKKTSSPVENNKKLAGGLIPNIYTIYNQTTPKLETDTIGDTAVGVAYASQDKNKMKCGGKKRSLKCGGKVRQKAENGWSEQLYNKDYYDNQMPQSWYDTITFMGNPSRKPLVSNTPILRDIPKFNYIGSFFNNTPTLNVPNKLYSTTNVNLNSTKGVSVLGSTPTLNVPEKLTLSSTPTKSSDSFWNNIGADLMGAGISSLGNIGGAWITSNANRYAANKLAEAYNTSADLLADAYRNLKTIDLSSIKREDYAAAHAMPALQAPISQSAAPIAAVNRQLQRRLSNAGKYSASSAAAQNRMTSAEVDAQDIKHKVYSADQEQMQKIRQGNAERVTQAAMQNAQNDIEAGKQFSNAYLNLLQYNNDIENQRLLGAAGALSEGATNAAGAIANAHTANATAWNNAMVNSGQSFANTLSAMATRKADLEKVMLGASGDTRSLYYANSGSYGDAKNYYNNLVRQYDLIKNSTKPEDQDTKAYLKRIINMVATGRNFDTV